MKPDATNLASEILTYLKPLIGVDTNISSVSKVATPYEQLHVSFKLDKDLKEALIITAQKLANGINDSRPSNNSVLKCCSLLLPPGSNCISFANVTQQNLTLRIIIIWDVVYEYYLVNCDFVYKWEK